ncbi:MAG: anti-sigma factor [Saprospiraceae bacterium]|nr:MAG: anti-sigma factor [Saprospiraceae bacterium]
MNIEQFLADPSFEGWARQSNAKDFAQWESWRAEHPENIEQMDEARALIVGLEFRHTIESKTDKQAEWDALSQRLNLSKRPAKTRTMNRRVWWSVAASLALIVTASWWFWPKGHAQEIKWLTATTAYGELQPVRLPDGTLVTLNANSSLRYPESWNAGSSRQVELTGEAFFEVTHKTDDAPFIVKAQSMEVHVLGTSFNVLARHTSPVVSLVEGKVRLNHIKSSSPVMLSPGETASFNEINGQFNIIKGKTNERTSWRDRRWVFDHTSLAEILQRIEDEFGLKIQEIDQQLLSRKVSGQVSTKQKGTLFMALEALLDVDITEENGQLRVED